MLVGGEIRLVSKSFCISGGDGSKMYVDGIIFEVEPIVSKDEGITMEVESEVVIVAVVVVVVVVWVVGVSAPTFVNWPAEFES